MRKCVVLLYLFMTVPFFAQQKITVYLLGVYHMEGTYDNFGVDYVKDDILGPKRQQQIGDLIGRLKPGNIEKIYVESLPEDKPYWDSIYRLHYAGKPVASRNEIFQIGIRLASKLRLTQGVTCVDWRQQEFRGLPGKASPYARSLSHELTDFNSRIPEMDLITVLQKMNSPQFLEKFYFINNTSFLDYDNSTDAAAQTNRIMERNLRIYSNIMKDLLTDRPRVVLILYGAGHIKALSDMLEAHPAIEIGDISKLLGR